MLVRYSAENHLSFGGNGYREVGKTVKNLACTVCPYEFILYKETDWCWMILCFLIIICW